MTNSVNVNEKVSVPAKKQSAPKFSVMIQSDGYKNLINNTLGDPKRAAGFITAIEFFACLLFFRNALSGYQILVQKEILYPDIMNSMIISPGFDVVLYNNDLFERVGYSDQRGYFPFFFLRIGNG